jgi:hypothetical protein
MSKKFVSVHKSELRRLHRVAQMYKDLYHGTIPADSITVNRKDWMTFVYELRRLRKLVKEDGWKERHYKIAEESAKMMETHTEKDEVDI